MPEEKKAEEYEELEHSVERTEHRAHSRRKHSKTMSKQGKSHNESHERRGGSRIMSCLAPVMFLVIIGMVLFALIAFQPAPATPLNNNPAVPSAQAQQVAAAPDFSLMKLDGTLFTLSGVQGSIVVLNFWSSGCAACPAEAFSLQAIQDGYAAQGVVVMGINRTDTDAAMRAFINQYKLTYIQALDTSGSVSTLYQVNSIPTTMIINRDGTIARVITTPVNYQSLKNILDPMLASGG